MIYVVAVMIVRMTLEWKAGSSPVRVRDDGGAIRQSLSLPRYEVDLTLPDGVRDSTGTNDPTTGLPPPAYPQSPVATQQQLNLPPAWYAESAGGAPPPPPPPTYFANDGGGARPEPPAYRTSSV